MSADRHFPSCKLDLPNGKVKVRVVFETRLSPTINSSTRMLRFYDCFNVAGVCMLIWIFSRNIMACRYAPVMVIMTIAAIFIEFLRIPPSTSDKTLKKWSNISVIAHRGAASDGPENTIYAIKQASANGAGGVEVDVGLTKDKQLVLLHDDLLDRTTDHSGPLSDYTLAQLTKVDAACKHPLYSRCGIQSVPTLRSVVLLALRLDLCLFIDLKASESEATIKALSKLFEEISKMYETCIIGSFSPYLIYQVRKAIPKAAVAITHQHNNFQFTADGVPKTSTDWDSNIAFTMYRNVLALRLYQGESKELFEWYRQGLIWHYIREKTKTAAKIKTYFLPLKIWILKDQLLEWSHHAWIWYMVGNSWFVVHKSDISPNYLKFWKERNVSLMAWTVNERVEKDYYHQLGIPVITDTLLD